MRRAASIRAALGRIEARRAPPYPPPPAIFSQYGEPSLTWIGWEIGRREKRSKPLSVRVIWNILHRAECKLRAGLADAAEEYWGRAR